MAKQIALLIVAAAVFSCDDEKKAQDIAPASPSAVASALGIDAAALGIAVTDPERPAGDLAADIAGFTTVEACMAKRTASLDPLVGDAVDAIGYDTFLRDACRVLEAAKAKDPKRCESIDASALRGRCRAVTAMVSGDPDGCPLRAPSKPEVGRDATCVAAAMRSVGMCAGASPRERAACEALVTHDAAKCDALVLPDQRAPCLRDAVRFRGVLGGSSPAVTLPAAKGTLTADSGKTVDLSADATSGIVLLLDGKHQRLTFGHVEDSGATRAVQPLERARFAVSLVTSDDKAARVVEANLVVPPSPRASCSSDACAPLTAKLLRLEAKRGGALGVVVDGMLGSSHVHAEIDTFVRDVVDRAGAH